MSEAPAWLINTFGVAAGLCSMASFVPQIMKIWRERCAAGVSVRMYMITVAGFCCWVVYGVLSNAWPVAVSNGVCVLLTVTILVLRLRFGEGQA